MDFSLEAQKGIFICNGCSRVWHVDDYGFVCPECEAKWNTVNDVDTQSQSFITLNEIAHITRCVGNVVNGF